MQDNWLSNSTNRFSLLADDDKVTDQPTNSGTKTNLQQTENQPKINKPPPIYVQGVEQIKTLNFALNNVIGKSYELKSLPNNEVRIQTHESAHYSAALNML